MNVNSKFALLPLKHSKCIYQGTVNPNGGLSKTTTHPIDPEPSLSFAQSGRSARSLFADIPTAQANACSSRSLPQNISPSTMKVGAPKMSKATASSVWRRMRSLPSWLSPAAIRTRASCPRLWSKPATTSRSPMSLSSAKPAVKTARTKSEIQGAPWLAQIIRAGHEQRTTRSGPSVFRKAVLPTVLTALSRLTHPISGLKVLLCQFQNLAICWVIDAFHSNDAGGESFGVLLHMFLQLILRVGRSNN